MMKILYLTQSLASLVSQLQGNRLTLKTCGSLRADVSTDEITPVAILSYYDTRLAAFAHTGLTIEGQQPLATGMLQAAGVTVLVAGARYGKGSSREHSPVAELWAGIKIVFAESFERIYRQNADNIGLITSTDFTLLERLEQGEDLPLEALIAEREPLAQQLLRVGGLLAYGRNMADHQQHLISPTHSAPFNADNSPKNLFEKIVSKHLCNPNDPMHLGTGVFVDTDWRFIHEYYTGMAAHMLDTAYGPELSIFSPDSVVVFEDHTSYVDESPAHIKLDLLPNMVAMQKAQRQFVERFSLRQHQTQTEREVLSSFSHKAAGISHAMMAESYVLPGQLVAGTDSHTPHSGALGCVAFGVGTTDMANALVTGAMRITLSACVKIELNGNLPAGVTAKDVVLYLLALPWIRSGAGVGKVFEFCGPVVRDMSIDERATLTNMTAELGGLTGIIAPDQTTVDFLRERRGVDFALASWMVSDEGAHYEHLLSIECDQLSPMLASPGDPGNGLSIEALKEIVPIDIAYGGSCTAGKREDFDHYHEVLAWGLERGLKLPSHVQLFLQYGTTAVRDYCELRGYSKVFRAIGARILQPSCGACANCGPGSSTSKKQVTVSAINRNFPGRSGPGQVWLASPPTVVASALSGYLCSFAHLKAKNLN
jgi:3-isopropylmalate/(R)-2-methylmalate dehydratase large subunit